MPKNHKLHPKQTQAFQTRGNEILYGGAAGGGKSHLMRIAMIWWCCHVPGLQCYLFRRVSEDLVKNHVEGPSGFRSLLTEFIDSGHVRFNDQKGTIGFWNGSKIFLCHCQYEKDRFKYQGAEIHLLCIDELTHFTDTIYRYLRGRVRVGELEMPEQFTGVFPRVLCGSNPGGVGHNWVKAAWIDLAPPMAITQMPDEEGGMLRQYIPAKLEDNPTLVKGDPKYLARLSGLGNAALVRAMRDGDWDIVAGGALDDVWDRNKHVIEPFEIPLSWRIDRSFDWGSSHPFSVGWWAESDGTEATLRDGSKRCWPRGTVFRIAEYYGWNGKPNEGCRLLAVEVARKIMEFEKAMFKNRSVTPGPADSSIFDAENGVSIADDMGRVGIRWIRADKSPGSRKIGLESLRRRLKAALAWPMEEPGLLIFDTCTHFIRTVPVLPRDEKKPDDVDSDAEDHCLSGESLVDTPDGQVMIKDIVGKEGQIFTAGGSAAWFHKCRKTKKSAQTVKVYFADGRSVVCTPDHRFLTKKNGWVEAKCLQIKTDIVTISHLNNGGEKCKLRLSAKGLRILMGRGIIFADDIFKEGGSDCTAQFTNFTAEKLKKASMCTTSTAIGRTTRLKIYRSLLAASTRLRIQKTKTAATGKTLCGKERPSGMGAMMVAPGTRSSTKSIARRHCQKRLKPFVSFAGQTSKGPLERQGFAQTSARLQRGERRALMRLQGSAQFAEVRSQEISTQSLKLALRLVAERSSSVEVVSVNPAGVEDVYCLDVIGWHSFSVCGGVIVHNCYDESRYRCMNLKRTTTVSHVSAR